MRVKKMPSAESDRIGSFSWSPVELESDAIPDWLKNMPSDAMHSVYASGTSAGGGSDYSDVSIGTGQLIGGIDVYRNAPEDPYDLNKDRYAVVVPPDDSPWYLIPGPLKKEDDHWMNEIPERLQGAEVFGVPKKPEAGD